MSQQLVKKGTNGKHENVMPKSWIEAIKDKNTGQTLVEILQGFNMYFLSYNGNTSATRCLVPTMLRKKGLWITYVKYDGNVYTEWYAADEIDDKSWGDSSNWRVGNNTLVGDITISANGNWVINGIETEFKAVGEKGNTPLLRVANNRLQVSYDLGDTYINVTNNPVYTKFRWLATTGDTQANNAGRIQASNDEGKTWTNMSNDFINNLHISRYVGVNESLPTSGIAEGTIYAKGPYYAEDDTLNDNPIYRLWVYAWKGNTLAWQDNGEFTSIAAGVVQETGDSETEVMSQKAVSEKLSELGSKTNNFTILGTGSDSVMSTAVIKNVSPNTTYLLRVLNPSWSVDGMNFTTAKLAVKSMVNGVEASGTLLSVSGADANIQDFYIITTEFDTTELIVKIRAAEGESCGFSIREYETSEILSLVTFSLGSSDTFSLSGDTLSMDKIAYLYKSGTDREIIHPFSLEMGFTGASASFKFVVYNTKTKSVSIINPGNLRKSPNEYLIAMLRKDYFGRISVHTNGNTHYDSGSVKLILPVLSINGVVYFNHGNMIIDGALYIYTANKREIISGNYELEYFSGVSRLIYDTIEKRISCIKASVFVNETTQITIGFICRDSERVYDVLMNVVCKKLVIDGKEDYEYNSTLKYIPHRGIRSAEIPENSIYSVLYTYLFGHKYIETDVRYTSDGVGIMHHDETINRVMCNEDGSDIATEVIISETSFEEISKYVYKTTNPLFKTSVTTIREFIDECARWGIFPYIQLRMSNEDTLYCYQKLGDRWCCYGGNIAYARSLSDNIMYMQAFHNYDNDIQTAINSLKLIGGKVALTTLEKEQLTDELIAACKRAKIEIGASFSYEKENIPNAINRGVCFVISDNIGHDTNQIEVSSLNGWDSFVHNGTIVDNKLLLTKNWLNYIISKKGVYNLFIRCNGKGKITLPIYTHYGVLSEIQFEITDNTFIMPFVRLDDTPYTISIDSDETLTLEQLIVFYEQVK